SDEHTFLLQKVQPAMVGLVDGSLSTLAPIFSIALATHNTRYAFIAGLATALGAGVSMGFSEGLSDTGELTGRGNPLVRGGITGGGTFLGGILHTLPFLIPHYHAALVVAIIVVGFALIALAFLRWRFFVAGFLADERQLVDADHPRSLARRGAAHAPPLARDVDPAVVVDLDDTADERLDPDRGPPPVAPAPPEPGLAELHRAAAGDDGVVPF